MALNRGVYNQRVQMREALITCLLPEDIASLTKELISISFDKSVKVSERIQAIRTVFEYSIAKPKQELEVNELNELKKANIPKIDMSLLTDEELTELDRLASKMRVVKTDG